jgi:hypothetical protein
MQPFQVDHELVRSWRGKILALTRASEIQMAQSAIWRLFPVIFQLAQLPGALKGDPGIHGTRVGNALSIWVMGRLCALFAYQEPNTKQSFAKRSRGSGTRRNYSRVSPCSRFVTPVTSDK